MKCLGYRSFLRHALAGLIGFFLTAGASMAQSGSATVTCASSTRQGNLTTCDADASITLNSTASDVLYGLRLTAPAAHCSAVAYGVTRAPFATGADTLGVTGALNGGMSEYVVLGRDWAPGSHPLRVSAIGFVGGCNTGVLGSWGVDWEVVIVPE